MLVAGLFIVGLGRFNDATLELLPLARDSCFLGNVNPWEFSVLSPFAGHAQKSSFGGLHLHYIFHRF